MAGMEQKLLFDTKWELPVENDLFARGYKLIAGADEVGRGALAGPLVTAAVILDPSHSIKGIKDSKKLSPKKREELADKIRKRAIAWSIDIISNEEVDNFNVLEATKISMRRSIKKLAHTPDLVLIDAIKLSGLDIEALSLVKGDQLSLNIGAASIIAKVFRDDLMCKFAKNYPAYGFDKNKGYGTREHLEALRNVGPCPVHRFSFKPIKGQIYHACCK